MRRGSYQVGPFSIERAAWGIDHGLHWGVWRDTQLVADFGTLKTARRYCAAILLKETQASSDGSDHVAVSSSLR